MLRCLAVGVALWIGLFVLISWSSLLSLLLGERDSYDSLVVYLALVYPLFLVVPAMALALLTGVVFSMPWWIRGVLAGAVCGGIVVGVYGLSFSFIWSTMSLAAATGFAIGVSAKKRKRAVITQSHKDTEN